MSTATATKTAARKATAKKATATKATAKKAAPKAAPAKATAKRVVGKDRTTAAKTVVNLRDKKHLSWGQIAVQLNVAPRTTRRMYDEVKGAGAHHGLLPGKGGRQVAA